MTSVEVRVELDYLVQLVEHQGHSPLPLTGNLSRQKQQLLDCCVGIAVVLGYRRTKLEGDRPVGVETRLGLGTKVLENVAARDRGRSNSDSSPA